jgi:hypothetical protein
MAPRKAVSNFTKSYSYHCASPAYLKAVSGSRQYYKGIHHNVTKCDQIQQKVSISSQYLVVHNPQPVLTLRDSHFNNIPQLIAADFFPVAASHLSEIDFKVECEICEFYRCMCHFDGGQIHRYLRTGEDL